MAAGAVSLAVRLLARVTHVVDTVPDLERSLTYVPRNVDNGEAKTVPLSRSHLVGILSAFSTVTAGVIPAFAECLARGAAALQSAGLTPVTVATTMGGLYAFLPTGTAGDARAQIASKWDDEKDSRSDQSQRLIGGRVAGAMDGSLNCAYVGQAFGIGGIWGRLTGADGHETGSSGAVLLNIVGGVGVQGYKQYVLLHSAAVEGAYANFQAAHEHATISFDEFASIFE